MTRYLITWKAVNSRIHENVEARVKQDMAFTQMVQEALKSGALKEWGTSTDGMKGYAIFDGSETDMALMSVMYVPFFEFEIYPILTADQWMGILKTVA